MCDNFDNNDFYPIPVPVAMAEENNYNIVYI